MTPTPETDAKCKELLNRLCGFDADDIEDFAKFASELEIKQIELKELLKQCNQYFNAIGTSIMPVAKTLNEQIKEILK